jgi:hypothetical protein
MTPKQRTQYMRDYRARNRARVNEYNRLKMQEYRAAARAAQVAALQKKYKQVVRDYDKGLRMTFIAKKHNLTVYKVRIALKNNGRLSTL